MKLKLNLITKAICLSLLALCFLFASCEDPEVKDPGNNNGTPDDGPYKNPYSSVRAPEFRLSNGNAANSGLHNASFDITLSTATARTTIYYSTDGSVPTPGKVGNGYVFEYTVPFTVKDLNNPMQPNVLSANHEKMYGVAGDRGNNMPRPDPEILDPAQVPKATVIRAVAVDANGTYSAVTTKTYFFGTLPNNYSNHRIISLVSDPVGLVGEQTGIMVRGAPGNRWEGTPYNFQRKGDEWERPAFLEIFHGDTSNRTSNFATEVGIRVRGGWSRATGQKSFSVYFKDIYGIKNLSRSTYDLIPGAKKADGSRVDTFKGFMLRNGANDAEYTKFYDVFLQDLLSDRSFSTQAGEPCIVYLNGEYWGPYNLQERYSDNHTQYKYGVDNANVISYDNGELDDGNPGEETLFLDAVNNFISTGNYSEFCNKFDINNFIDYWAAEIYIYNEDWPHNNYRIWRARNTVPNNPYGDTKWRYQMFDTEFALGIYNDGRTTGQANMNAFDKILNGEHNWHLNNQLFKKLITNADFCKQFVNTMMDLYNVNFNPNNYTSKLNDYTNKYKPLMGNDNTTGTYFNRWGGWWDDAFMNWANQAEKYLHDIRDAMVYNYLPTYFGSYIGSAYDVTLYTTGPSASIKVNSVNVQPGWTGKYYSNNPITVTAKEVSGYTFTGWTVTGGTPTTSTVSTLEVTITGNAQITANYTVGSAVKPVTNLTLNKSTLTLTTGGTDSTLVATVTPNDATYKTVYWTSSNPSVASVGFTSGVVTAVSSGTATITANTSENTHPATCTVTVTAVVTGVSLDESNFNIFVGEARKLTATVSPSNAPNKETRWTSNNPSVATVTGDGTVKAVGSGTATITVTTVDGGQTATCTVSVKTLAQATVLLDLAERLSTLTPKAISDWNDWGTAFYDLPINPAGELGTEVTFEITSDKKLKVNDFLDWASGLRVITRPEPPLQATQLQAGDRIEIKGTFLNGPNNSASGDLFVNTGCGYIDGDANEDGVVNDNDAHWWRPIGSWSFSAKNTDFQQTFILSADDAIAMNANPDWSGAFALRMNGYGYPQTGAIVSGGIGSFSVEQIKIYRF